MLCLCIVGTEYVETLLDRIPARNRIDIDCVGHELESTPLISLVSRECLHFVDAHLEPAIYRFGIVYHV